MNIRQGYVEFSFAGRKWRLGWAYSTSGVTPAPGAVPRYVRYRSK